MPAIETVAKDPAVAAKLASLGVVQDYQPPESLQAEIRAEQLVVEEMIKKAHAAKPMSRPDAPQPQQPAMICPWWWQSPAPPGIIYGVELLRVLKDLGQPTHLILSEAADLTLGIETDYTLEQVRAMATVVHNNRDVGASVASGSFRTRGMIVAPCTIKTLSAIANSFNYNLVARAADVQLKEGRKLVLMVRETPLHKGHLDLMSRAATAAP